MDKRVRINLAGYRLIAGHPCLDFVNTLGGNRAGETKEYLSTYADLVTWGHQVGFLSRSETLALMKRAGRTPEAATEVLDRARTLREAIYRLVTGSLYRRSPRQEDLFLVSREAAFAVGRARIIVSKDGFSWSWPEVNLDLDRVIWPISRSAADLMTSSEVMCVRECASDRCTWVFLDTSKNHSRRWCDMKDCGNREKIRRFRMR